MNRFTFIPALAFQILLILGPSPQASWAAGEEKVIGDWKLETLELGKQHLQFKEGGKWTLNSEIHNQKATREGTWTTELAPKKDDSGILIKSQFVLQLQSWISKTDALPEGAVIVENSSDGKSVLVREVFQGTIQNEADPAAKTLVLYRLLENKTTGIPTAITRRYSWVKP